MMRSLFFQMVVRIAALCALLGADDGADEKASDADTEFDVRISILEGSRKSVTELGFDLTQVGVEQQSSLSPAELKSKLRDLKKSNLKRLAEPCMKASLNELNEMFSGGETTIGQELVEFGTRVEITPTRQPDGNVNLRWYVSQVDLQHPKAKFFGGKKPPIVHRHQLQGNVAVQDRQLAFVIPTVSTDQDDVWLLQFYVEELLKPSGTPARPVAR